VIIPYTEEQQRAAFEFLLAWEKAINDARAGDATEPPSQGTEPCQ
jgi:hypothetical protein